MLQVGLHRAFGFGMSLSGVTPGEREGLEFRRVSATAHYFADMLTPGQIGWSILLSSRHVRSVALARARHVYPGRQTDRRTNCHWLQPDPRQAMEMA